MARSNGIQDRTAAPSGRPARAANAVDPGLPWNPGVNQGGQPGYPADPQFAQQGFEPQPTGRPTGPSPGQLPWPQAGHHAAQPYPQQGSANQGTPHQGYGQQASYSPQQGYPQPQIGYAADPHHGHYFPQAPAEQPPQAYPGPAYPEPAAQLRGSFPGHGEQADQTAPLNAGYQSQPGYPAHQQPVHDPRGYDLGAYATPQTGYADPLSGRGQQQPMPQGGYPNAYAQPLPGQPQFNQAHADPHAPAEDEFEDDEDYEDEEEDAPRRFGLVKVIASLAIAIGIGAGGAYGYKKYASPTVAAVKPMAARADSAAPTNRLNGEQKTASADLKSGERLNDVPAVVPSGDADTNAPGGTRRVQIQNIPVTPQGMPGMAVQPPMRPTISVPGMSVEGMVASAPPTSGFPPVTAAPVGRAVAPPPAQAQPARAPVAPRVIAAVEDPVTAPAKPAPQKVAVPKVAKANDAYNGGVASAQVGAPPAPASTAVASAANGYVAVLSSLGSAVDARKSLDDQQSKYGEVLGGKPTDVTQFVSPKDGKTYYRAIVGPPGSREAAVSVCSQLKAAGHKDCFAAAY